MGNPLQVYSISGSRRHFCVVVSWLCSCDWLRVCVCDWMQNSLRVLDVSGNGLTSLEPLSVLQLLEQLTAGNNKLSNMTELVELLGLSWRRLQRLDLSMNQLCHQRRYRDRIIVMSQSLGKWHCIHDEDANDCWHFHHFPNSEHRFLFRFSNSFPFFLHSSISSFLFLFSFPFSPSLVPFHY